jgi:hypothetical protein
MVKYRGRFGAERSSVACTLPLEQQSKAKANAIPIKRAKGLSRENSTTYAALSGRRPAQARQMPCPVVFQGHGIVEEPLQAG